MMKFDKWFFPEGEQHLPDWMAKVNKRVDGRLTYQYGKYEAALKYIKQNRLAVDVGSHIGLWAWFMARDFENVACFEPMPEHILCWRENMKERENAELWEYALGEQQGFVKIATRTPGSSGDTGVVAGPGDITMKPLDDFDFQNLDFLKIDCEGYEEFVLRGARETLVRCKPCVIVEQKGTMSQQYGLGLRSAVEFLQALGAKLRHETSGDYILSWD